MYIVSKFAGNNFASIQTASICFVTVYYFVFTTLYTTLPYRLLDCVYHSKYVSRIQTYST